MPDQEKILITGASGFVGGRLVEVLYLNQLFDVRAMVRDWSSCARIGRFPVDIVVADLMDQQALEKAMNGVYAIVHCAYGSHGSPETTITGTANVLRAAQKTGVKKIVHISTAEVYGNVVGEITEDFPYQYSKNSYADSKIEAEKKCLEFMNAGMSIVILRPSIIYGPFSRNWTMNIGRMLFNRQWSLSEKHGNGWCNLVYIDDLIRAIIKSLTVDTAIGHSFNISGSEHVTWNEYFCRFNSILDLPPLTNVSFLKSSLRTALMEPVRYLGNYALKNHGDFVKFFAAKSPLIKNMMKKTETTVKATPCPKDLDLYSRKSVYSIGKAHTLLGFDPVFNLQAGLEITVDWLKMMGFTGTIKSYSNEN